MSRLAGLRYKDVIRKLRQAGFIFDRQAKGSHEIWWNPETEAIVAVPKHPGDIPVGTVRAILKQAGLDIKKFEKL